MKKEPPDIESQGRESCDWALKLLAGRANAGVWKRDKSGFRLSLNEQIVVGERQNDQPGGKSPPPAQKEYSKELLLMGFARGSQKSDV